MVEALQKQTPDLGDLRKLALVDEHVLEQPGLDQEVKAEPKIREAR